MAEKENKQAMFLNSVHLQANKNHMSSLNLKPISVPKNLMHVMGCSRKKESELLGVGCNLSQIQR